MNDEFTTCYVILVTDLENVSNKHFEIILRAIIIEYPW